MPKMISSVDVILDKYDHFIIDIWGVLHDGVIAYKNAKKALEILKSHDKQILLLSNAPRASSVTKVRLQSLGFHASLYDHVLTSGDLLTSFFLDNKKKSSYCHIGKEMDENIINSIGYDLVSDYNKADFIICTGYQDLDLSQPLALRLKLYCANPDLAVVRQDGSKEYCAGFLAKKYLQLGGEVEFFGKPGLFAYKKAISMLGAESKERVLCIGDSFHTDIAGANNANLDSIFIAGGLHNVDSANIDQLTSLEKDYKCQPTYVMQHFS